VAEDNAVSRRVVLLQLGRLGYEADLVSSGRELLELLEKRRYDLLFLDCLMPAMDGYKVARAIRRMEGARRWLWIIAMTGAGLAADRDRCFESGMDDYLPKPVRLDALRRALERALAALRRRAPEGRTHVAAAVAVDVERSVEDVSVSARLPRFDPEMLSELREIGGGRGSALAREVVALFALETPLILGRMRTSLEAGDLDGVRVAAHSLKGSSRCVGALQLGGLCERLEGAARANARGLAGSLLGRITVEFDAVLGRLRVFEAEET